jgi:uncharacterized protein
MEQRVSLITLGVRDVPRARRFYEQGLGWHASGPQDADVAFYQTGGMIVALYKDSAMAADAGQPAPPETVPFRGVVLAHNVPNPQLVDALLLEAERAGGRILKPGAKAFWGGYTGTFSDPEGHLWEVAWNPGFDLRSDGTIHLPG